MNKELWTSKEIPLRFKIEAWIYTIYMIVRYGLDEAEVRMNKEHAKCRQLNLEYERSKRDEKRL